MSAICVIPAKGTSRRIPRKNIRPFHGKPIICYSIEVALNSKLFSTVYVSTDDIEIAAIAQSAGAEPMMRPPELCEDRYGPLDVTARLLFALGYAQDAHPEFACTITATSPLMSVADLTAGLNLLRNSDALYSFGIGHEPPKDAGQFYWGRSGAYLRGEPLVASSTVIVPIANERCCDINTEEDWNLCEAMYSKLYGRHLAGNVFA